MEHPHCAANPPAEGAGHCEDHSGQLMWMRGIATLLMLAVSLLGYSVFWQAPAMRIEIAKEVARVDGDIKLVKKDVERHDSDISSLRGRVEKLENSSQPPFVQTGPGGMK